MYALCFIIVCTFSLSYAYLRYRDGIAILGYHDVVSDEEKEQYYKDNVWVISESKFEEQMKYLSDHGYTTLTMEQLDAYYNNDLDVPKKSVVLTFDDGFQSFNKRVKPVLEKYDMQATCFVIGRKTQMKQTKQKGKYQYLSQKDLVNDENVQYYSHTYNFHHFASFFRKQMEVASYEEIMDDFEENENIVSDRYVAFPYGKTSENAKAVLKQRGVHLAFGAGQNRKMVRSDDRYLLPRYNVFDFLPLWAFQLYID